MPVVRSEDVQTVAPHPGFELRIMVEQAHGSQAVTMVVETLHPGGKIPVHRHKVEGALYVMTGSGNLSIEGEGEYKVEAGMGILIPANAWYTLWNDGTDDFKWVTAHPAVSITREER
ncbi:MAG: cupin domain-containing protein [Armatimonadetes bacterium]|nr:cupin domain-containing protein [Armatimonadota bacterium]